jgi:hypothetical protein
VLKAACPDVIGIQVRGLVLLVLLAVKLLCGTGFGAAASGATGDGNPQGEQDRGDCQDDRDNDGQYRGRHVKLLG